jgi:phosphatidylglycerol:prolipoprotein diacylglycerol transferase
VRGAIQAFLVSHGLGATAFLVPTDGAMYLGALVVMVWLFLRRCRVLGVPGQRALEVVFAAAVGAVVGTRLFYLLTMGDILRLSPLAWFDLSRGTASWGAYLGAATGMVLLLAAKRNSLLPYLDTAASVTPLGTAIGRLGCFLAGDDFGRVATLPWSMAFPPGSPVYRAHAAGGLIAPGAEASLRVHPLQLYLLINALVVFGITSWVWRRWRSQPGLTLAVYFAWYGVTRFGLEFLRDPAAGGSSGLFSTSQVLALGFTGAGLAVGWFVLRRAKEQRRAAMRRFMAIDSTQAHPEFPPDSGS